MYLDDVLDAYARRQMRSAAAGSVRLAQFTVRQFGLHLGHRPTLDDLTDDIVSGYAAARRRNVAPATVNRDLAVLLALWRWSHRRGWIGRWPDVPLEPEPHRTPQAWSRTDFERLLAAAYQRPGRIGEHLACRWWPALLLVLYDTGERIGAVLSLPWQCVDLHSRWITFAAETRKGAREDNVVQVAADTSMALTMIRRPAGPVFPWPYSRTLIWLHMSRLLRSAGLPSDRRSKFHRIRRTTASHYEAAGGNATELLKHSSRAVTLAYIDPTIVHPVQAVDLLWRPRIE